MSIKTAVTPERAEEFCDMLFTLLKMQPGDSKELLTVIIIDDDIKRCLEWAQLLRKDLATFHWTSVSRENRKLITIECRRFALS